MTTSGVAMMSGRQAHQLLDAATVVINIQNSTVVEFPQLPQTENVVRPLGYLRSVAKIADIVAALCFFCASIIGFSCSSFAASLSRSAIHS